MDHMTAHLTLVTGGTRSGKSTFAQTLANKEQGSKVFIATAEPLDQEMERRIALHKKERPET